MGGIIIGTTRHGMELGEAADIFTKLSVGDGLVAQIPALIVSLAAGLLVSKGGTRGLAETALLGQLGSHPRALLVASGVMVLLSVTPGLPMFPLLALALVLGFVEKVAEKFVMNAARSVEEEERRESFFDYPRSLHRR